MSKAEERALEAFPLKIEGDSRGSYDLNELNRQKFLLGYHQAEKDLLDNIWHSPDEEPEIDRKIIWESENFLGKHLDKEWKPKIDCFGKKERWCYLADILPSRNWTGERPYSKVDYSRGYDNGYEQAEKDLELSWNDIALILNAAEEFNRKNTVLISDEEYFKEILKRFKNYKK